MKTLFLDTHDEKITAILKVDENIFLEEVESSRNHSEVAVALLEKLFKRSNIGPKLLDLIIVVNGPGSFTGVRIGVTIAKTMAFSLNIPIKTITSLEMYGVSSSKKFDLVTVEDSKGVYSVKCTNNVFKEIIYQRKSIYEDMIKKNNLKVLDEKVIDIDKIIDYLKNIEEVNPHLVNPIYIKEIDALK